MAKQTSSSNGAAELDELTDAVVGLSEEVRVLRQAVDDLREEIQWAARNLVDPDQGSLANRRIRTMPLDPCAADFAERVNATAPALLSLDTRCEESQHSSTGSSVERSIEQPAFCCEQPSLQWFGTPDAPDIGCTACGYLVAQEGDILCWNDDGGKSASSASPPSKAQQQQRDLF